MEVAGPSGERSAPGTAVTLFDVTPPMRRDASLSTDERYRWWLGRSWAARLGRVCWVMLNPSTANATVDDQTVLKCIGFTQRWGYGALDVVNAYAWRTTKPENIPDDLDLAVGPHNDTLLQHTMATADLVIAAWGASYPDKFTPRMLWVGQLARRHGAHHLGLTKNGSPRHPLYVPYRQQPQLWTPDINPPNRHRLVERPDAQPEPADPDRPGRPAR